jgi:hypothetical protein
VAFTQDRKTVYAVVRALEIISEASRRLPAEITGRHAEIDCTTSLGFERWRRRNWLVSLSDPGSRRQTV